jgi:hypothetical protein
MATSGPVPAPSFGLVDPWGAKILAEAALALLFAAGLGLAWPLYRTRLERGWAPGYLGTFLLGLGVRLSVEPAMANWYTEIALPGATPGRFGSGALVLQEWLGTVLPWHDQTLFISNAILGALAVPLTMALCQSKGTRPLAAIAAALFVALAPLHVRVSASASPHVLASTCVLVALVLSTAAVRRGRWELFAVAVAAMLSASLTRADAWPQLGFVAVWGLLPKQGPDAPKLDRGAWLRAGGLMAAWVAIGAFTYYAVVVPSRHPSVSLDGALKVAARFPTHYIDVGFTPPYWVSPVAVVMAGIGCVRMVSWARPLMLGVVGFLAFAFIATGRDLRHDELLGARYFLATIPVFAIAAGFGIEWLGDFTTRSARHLTENRAVYRWVSPMLALLTISAAIVATLPAYRATFTFHEEYRFLRPLLASTDPNCTVYQIPVRSNLYELDLDCCLDGPNSPLRLAHGGRQLKNLDLLAPALPDDGCSLYYESAACSMQATPEVRSRRSETHRAIQSACSTMRDAHEWKVLGRAQVSGHSTHDVFGEHLPTVRLLQPAPPG